MKRLKEFITCTAMVLTTLSASSQVLNTHITPVGCSDNGYEERNATVFTANAQATIDGSTETFYHSPWRVKRIVNAENPIILTYSFDGKQPIRSVTYIPRQDGGVNGIFTEFDVLIQTAKDKKPHLWKHFTWEYSSSQSRTIDIPDKLQIIKKIEFHVTDGYKGFVSCAEMQFNTQQAIRGVFADNLCTRLLDHTEKKDLKALPYAALRSLADSLAVGKYNFNYRLASYDCYESPACLAKMWMSPSTIYDMQPGVTGINITKGTHLVAADNIPEGTTAQLRLIAFYNGKVAPGNGNHSTLNDPTYKPVISTTPLNNGINIIDYKGDTPALAYVCYMTDTIGSTHPSIRVHFIGGEVNGYITPETDKLKARAMLSASPNGHMDMVGSKVHSVWTSQGLLNYCKDYDEKPDGYSDFIHLLDSLVDWEHQVLGYKKFGLVPHNRTFAYVNYRYYFYRDGLGVSFNHTQEKRILNCNRLKYKDQDAIWGMSHEWGHLHQVNPYFCWDGLVEVSNNINSIYNVLRMGYKPSQVGHIRDMEKARLNFVNDKYKDTVSINRTNAAMLTDYLADYPELQELCKSMANGIIDSIQGVHGLSQYELGQQQDLRDSPTPQFGQLFPLAILYQYITNTKGYTDFWPDLMKAIRETELSDDKYALLATYQNHKEEARSTLLTKYPDSYWVTHAVTTTGRGNIVPYILNFIRQASLTSGYNLVPLFEKYGYLRQLALVFPVYGRTGLYMMTRGMYNEFIQDMNELVQSGKLKQLSESMLSDMENVFN